MPRYVAFLRGVSPSNAKMPDLKRAFERAGFTDVTTVLSSGNVVFTSRAMAEPALERKAVAGMNAVSSRAFGTIIRSSDALRVMLDEDPYASFRLRANAKRVVTFLRAAPASPPRLPVELDGARILAVRGREAFTAYEPSPRGPVFMTLIEKTFGKDVTTRTWDTVRKCAAS